MTTPRLALDELLPSQSQPHIPLNTSLRKLEAIVQLSCVDIAVNTPPVSPADADTYIVGGAPTGDWTGFAEGSIAYFATGIWVEVTPLDGWLAWVQSVSRLYVYAADSPSGWGVLVATSGGQIFDPRSSASFYDDFWRLVSNGENYSPWDAYYTGTNGIVETVDHVAGHPGIARITVGTSAASRSGFLWSNNANGVNSYGGLRDTGACTLDFVFRVPTLPASTANTISAYIGFINAVISSGSACAVGIKLQDDGSDNIRLYGACNTDGTESVTGTYTTAVAGTWYHGRIVTNSAWTSIEFFIDGVSRGSLTTNIPSRPLTLGAVGIRETSSVPTLLYVDIDVMLLTIDLPARWT